MISFEEAGVLLDSAAEQLPKEIFEDLNGGVNLLPDEKLDEDGNHIMGYYHHDEMGRYVEIFFGSFQAMYGSYTPAQMEKELKRVLYHELTHHIENKAGDRSLEKWDAEQKALWAMGAPLKTDSVLFASDDGILASAAEAFFRLAAPGHCPRVRFAAGRLLPAQWELGDDARDAAKKLGIPLPAVCPDMVEPNMLGSFSTVLCMTLAQADALAEKLPQFDEKIMCLGQSDITPPKLLGSWVKTFRRVGNEIDLLVEELEQSAQ